MVTMNDFIEAHGVRMEFMPALVNPRTVWFGAHRIPKIEGEIGAVHNVLQAAEQWLSFCCLIRRPNDPFASVAVAYTSFNREKTPEAKPSLAAVLDRMAYEASLADRFPTVEAWEMFAQYCEDQIDPNLHISADEKLRRDREFEKIRQKVVEAGFTMPEIKGEWDRLLFKPNERWYRSQVLPEYKLQLELAKESKTNLLRLFSTVEYDALIRLPRLRQKYFIWQLSDDELDNKELLYG